MFDLVIDGGIARLTLNRPEARNAIPVVGWDRLAGRAAEAEAGGARLLVLTGAGSAFCAGADIGEFTAFHADPGAASGFRLAMRRGIDAIRNLTIPTIARIEGPCFGAGVALAMACDIRLAGSGARFAITPAKFGISYPQEDVHRLIALVGEGQAARLLFGAGTIDGAEAERIGLVESYAGPELKTELDGLTASISACDPDSLRVLKRGLRLAARKGSDAVQDRSFDALLGSDALAAFLSRRGAKS
jgi:enoyl-CoA hydratase/carnithine racemase